MVLSLTFCIALLLSHKITYVINMTLEAFSFPLFCRIIYVQFLVGNLVSYLTKDLITSELSALVTHANRNFMVNVNKVGGCHLEACNKALM